jgi:hypothetical protein
LRHNLRLDAHPGWNDALERGRQRRDITPGHPLQQISQRRRGDRRSKYEAPDRFEPFLGVFEELYDNSADLSLPQRDPHEGADFYVVSKLRRNGVLEGSVQPPRAH